MILLQIYFVEILKSYRKLQNKIKKYNVILLTVQAILTRSLNADNVNLNRNKYKRIC